MNGVVELATGTPTTKKFQERLEELIRQSGKDIKELSEEIGISTGALSKYQNDAAEAGINALKKIAVHFKVSCDWLLGGAETKTADNEAIYRRLGLNEATISCLEECHGIIPDLQVEVGNWDFSSTVNALIGTADFWSLISQLHAAIAHAKQVNSVGEYGLTKTSGFDSATENEYAKLDKDLEKIYGSRAAVVSRALIVETQLQCTEQIFHNLIENLPVTKEFREGKKAYWDKVNKWLRDKEDAGQGSGYSQAQGSARSNFGDDFWRADGS